VDNRDLGLIASPRCGVKQTPELEEWCIFLEAKLRNKMAWRRSFWPTWIYYIREIGLERMMLVVKPLQFRNAWYLLRGVNPGAAGLLESLRLRIMEEKWQAIKHYKPAVENARVRSMVDYMIGETKKAEWNALVELKKIQVRTGVRSKEARRFADKWGLTLAEVRTEKKPVQPHGEEP